MPSKYILPLFAFLISGTPALAVTSIACVGNSITAGYGLDNAYLESYPSQWQNLLGTTDYSVTNYGMSGTTFLRHGDNPYWNQLSSPLSSSPDQVIIELGTNDSKTYNWQNHQDSLLIDYEDLVDTFQTLASAPKIWVCLAPYANNSSWDIMDTTIVNHINPVILEAGLEKGVNIIDLHSTFTDRSWLNSSDTVHPNATGAAALASIINGFFQRDTLQISQNGSELTAPAGYAYQWYKDGIAMESATGSTLSLTATGAYKVSVKVDSDNDSRIVTQELSVTTLDPTGLPLQDPMMPTMSFAGGILSMTLSTSMKIEADLLDMQGRLLNHMTWEGTRGSNAFALPRHNSPCILRILTGKAPQLLLIPRSESYAGPSVH